MRGYGLLVVCIAMFLYLSNIGWDDPSESGPLEHFQLIVLSVAMGLWLWRAFSSEFLSESSPRFAVSTVQPLPQAFCIGMAWLMFIFLVKETSWLRIWHIDTMGSIPTKIIGIMLFTVLFIGAAIRWRAALHSPVQAYLSIIKCPAFGYIIGSACMLLSSNYFENMETMPHHIYIEETVELFGFVTLCYAAWRMRRVDGAMMNS